MADHVERIEMNERADGTVLELTLTGKLTKDDYRQFAPRIEEQVNTHGKVKMLVVLKDFHGWSVGATWEDIKFDVRHFNDIDKLALVGEKAWEKGMAVFCKPFTTASVRYFEKDDLEEARAWIEAD